LKDSARKCRIHIYMSKWAILNVAGKQYKVAEGDKLSVEKIAKNGKTADVVFDKVLAIGDDSNVTVGKPNISGAKVQAKIIEDFKEKKVRVVKFKSKSRYLKTRGHRHQKTRILVEKILA
jgi:large subunit ribosomal protein L21